MRNKNAKVSDPSNFVSDPGSDIHVLYTGKLCPNGQIRLSESGKESISEKINAEKMYTDISYIMSRLELGDTSVIRPASSLMYGDLTKAPKTLADHLQIFINARSAFNELDLDTRSKFGNNYMKWLQDAGTDDWLSVMKDYLPDLPDVKVVDSEVNENES